MFGKPHWFAEKSFGWGIVPASWQGWFFFAAWASVVVAPFLGLLAMAKLPEALIWIAVSSLVCFWDVRHVARELRQKKERDALFYIGEEADSHVATKNFDLQVRDSDSPQDAAEQKQGIGLDA